MLEWILFAVVCLAAASIVWSTLRLGISPMPSSRAVRTEVLALLDPALEGELHELGAGWGSLAFPIARHCPNARVIAHEGSLVPYVFCVLRKTLTGASNVEVRFGNFLRADLRHAAGVIAYLWTGGMEQLAPKFEAELPAGSFVISHTFAWRGREAELQRTATDLYRTPIYRYRIHQLPSLPPR
ncbi:MAG: SAM-dependent methyltransferase [Myxococcaceae bacterium]